MTETKLAMYEQTVSYAAIDAGADLVLAEHAHILRAIEQYKGKTIYHGLGSFVDPPTPPVLHSNWMTQQKNRLFKDSFGFEFSESQPLPKIENSKLTIIAKCVIDGGKISSVGFLPCIINDIGKPEILKHADRGQQVDDCVDKITRGIGLNPKYEWDGDEIIVSSLPKLEN
jgi:poly-gamma-glutamate synthesis protein (capsule biosynthesis protein)